MKLGIFSFNTGDSIEPHRLARAAEERGFESLWVPEHTHIPVPMDGGDPKTGMPPAPGGEFLPEEYRHMPDPFTTLAAAAAVTESLLLGTCICLINQHHPINLAKSVATLDQISNGRFIFGVGAGWNVAEMNHHGVEFEDRWAQLRERLEALRTLWTQEKPGFSGDWISFEPSWQYPKPARSGGPPVVLGTLDTPFGRRQVARHGDGWLPLTFDLESTSASVTDVRRQMAELGRDPASLDVSLFFLDDVLQNADTVRRAADTDATRLILRLPVADESSILSAMDHYAAMIT